MQRIRRSFPAALVAAAAVTFLQLAAFAQSASTPPVWQSLGPTAVQSQNYGLVTGRVTALALDPSDGTGDHLYVGTTGGGVWASQNASTSDPANVTFTPLTDNVSAMTYKVDASISIGALSVQPGGTGVILAGTGDPNGALDSYYGAGILRSTDNGVTWSLIQETSDLVGGEAATDYSFVGEAIAGFAWSTTNPAVVVAAVSQAYEGLLVGARWPNLSYTGLYYSNDSGATWHLARIGDSLDTDIQGPLDAFVQPDGNAATSVTWNPVRHVFLAAVRLHGYYQSSDGVRWIRLASQPGSGLTTKSCPARPTLTGALTCPLWRGTLAVNPLTGDTFAWTVDANLQDQGIWQDICAFSNGSCASSTLSFSKQWSTQALQTNTMFGPATIANGNYNLAIAAVPSNNDTLLLAGDNDLWRCSLAAGCVWRNTTNARACMAAQVGPYQHALEWDPSNPSDLFIGNDSGLWRSTDDVGQAGAACDPTDSAAFQNLNATLGSLAEVRSISAASSSVNSMMLGLGVNGTAAIKDSSPPPANWPQVLAGDGGPVAIDPQDANTWYSNTDAGVAIYRCSQSADCTPGDFGSTPAISQQDVAGDGLAMLTPASFLVDPADHTQLLVGTCRVWRGPAIGGWTKSNAISPILDGNTGSLSCSNAALIRSIAAYALPAGGEVVYVGTYSTMNGSASLPGHVLSASMSPDGKWSSWADLTLNPVSNDQLAFNSYRVDISSIYVDPHDTTGNTIYVTLARFPSPSQAIYPVYQSSDGGAHWNVIQSNLPFAPANTVIVDPLDANTLYIAIDIGVFATRQASACATPASNCWAPYGAGLPASPVTALLASSPDAASGVLTAATYGRGVWQIPLMTAGEKLTSATVSPTSLSFAGQAQGTISDAQVITITNTGASALVIASITPTGDFLVDAGCAGKIISAAATCAISVTFAPAATGVRTGLLTVAGNIGGGTITIPLTGTGEPPPLVTVLPAALDFGKAELGSSSPDLQVTVENGSSQSVSITSLVVAGAFSIVSNACGNSSLAPMADCQITLRFTPQNEGSQQGKLTLIDGAGTQVVQLSGTGTTPPTDTLAPTSLNFPSTIVGVASAVQIVTLTNTGENALTGIAVSTSPPFQVDSNCTTQLASNSSCSLKVTFTPSAAGTQSGTLTVVDILRTQTVALSGVGLLPPVIDVHPDHAAFDSQPVGQTSAPIALTVTNTGGAPMDHIGVQINGPSASSFSADASSCSGSLMSGSSCPVPVRFTPATAGAAIAKLILTSSTSGVKPVSIPLNGSGQATGLTISPAQLGFAPQALGQTSAAQSVTISNLTAVPADSLTFVVTGPFALTQNQCGSSLAPAASCDAAVTFTPMQAGELSGLLTVSSSSVSPPFAVALKGTGGLTGSVQIDPQLISFPVTGLGAASDPLTVSVTNLSTSLSLDALKIRATGDFRIAANACSSSLPPGATCTVAVLFAPSATGVRTGSLALSSSSLTDQATVGLSGTGFDFAVSVSGADTRTVARGQIATYSVSLVPLGGVSGTFTFLCKSLPANASCNFNPASEIIAAGASGTAAVEIATGVSAAAASRPSRSPSRQMRLLYGMLVVPFTAGIRRRRWTLLLLSIAATLVCSCASSGGGTGGAADSSTPLAGTASAGTYTVSVEVSANGVRHTVTVTLVVD